jgi:hypothetical protein
MVDGTRFHLSDTGRRPGDCRGGAFWYFLILSSVRRNRIPAFGIPKEVTRASRRASDVADAVNDSLRARCTPL